MQPDHVVLCENLLRERACVDGWALCVCVCVWGGGGGEGVKMTECVDGWVLCVCERALCVNGLLQVHTRQL